MSKRCGETFQSWEDEFRDLPQGPLVCRLPEKHGGDWHVDARGARWSVREALTTTPLQRLLFRCYIGFARLVRGRLP